MGRIRSSHTARSFEPCSFTTIPVLNSDVVPLYRNRSHNFRLACVQEVRNFFEPGGLLLRLLLDGRGGCSTYLLPAEPFRIHIVQRDQPKLCTQHPVLHFHRYRVLSEQFSVHIDFCVDSSICSPHPASRRRHSHLGDGFSSPIFGLIRSIDGRESSRIALDHKQPGGLPIPSLVGWSHMGDVPGDIGPDVLVSFI